jgi:hypothetical protein
MFLIYTLYVQIVTFNDKMYTNYSQILLRTFIRLKNTLPNKQETNFLSDICVFFSGRRIMDKPIKITNGEFRLICLSYRAKEPCSDYVKLLFSHSTLRRKP